MKMKVKMRQVFGIILSLVLVLGLMPGMSLTTYAESVPPTVTISPEGTGTVTIEPSTNSEGKYILTANPNAGYAFDYWTQGGGGQVSNLGGNKFEINGGQSITCVFFKPCIVTYKVVGGTWSDGTTADKTTTVKPYHVFEDVPTGMIAAPGYTGGSWDSDVPYEEYPSVAQDTTFTYTFEPDPSQSKYKVTYKVVNGAWDEGDEADRTITLTGVNATLAAENIPHVGTKPDAGYKEGSWDVTPTAGTSITGDVTFTYTYVKDISGESSGGSSDSGSGDSSGGSSDSGSGSSSSGSTDSGSGSSSGGSSDSGNTSGGTSSGSSDNTNTNTDTSTKVPYNDVAISTGSVNDITGTASATAESNPFGTKIENSSNLTTLLSLTDAEVAQGVNVWLDIQDMSASVPQADKTLIQNTSGDYTVGLYLDINLFKKVGSNDATKVTETKGKVKASIVIPESLWKSGRTFEIIRVHDGVATAIAGTYDENTHVFTFETDKFSTYALAYKDPASSSDSTSTSDSNSSNSSNSTQSTAPKTGDPNDIRVWYLLLIASFGGLGFLGYSKKKKVND